MIYARIMEHIKVLSCQSVDVHHHLLKGGKRHDSPHAAIPVSQQLKDFRFWFY